MRINKILEYAAAFDPTKKSNLMTVTTLCKKIDDQLLSLPLYQRDLSWTLQKCIALLNYQLLGKAPVSPISMNEITKLDDIVPQVAFITREIIPTIGRGQYSVVDGQQRLATNYKAYINHQDFRSVVLDLGKGEFTKTDISIKANQIPVGILLNRDDRVLFSYIKDNSTLGKPEVLNLIIKIRNKMLGYNYTINMAEDLTEDEQIEWFEVLNNAGSRVSIIQMRFSKLKAHGIDIYTQYTHIFNEKLAEVGCDDFFVPQKTVVSYPIAALNPAFECLTSSGHNNNCAPIPSDTKENQLCSLSPDDLSRCFAITLDALEKTITFFEETGLDIKKRIDYVNYIIGYIVFNGEPTDQDDIDYLVNWFESTDFTNKTNTERRKIYTSLIEKKSLDI